MTIEEYRKTQADREVRNMMRLHEKSEHIYATGMGQARREGLAEGMEKGEAKGKVGAAHKMLLAGMERGDIARILELPENSF